MSTWFLVALALFLSSPPVLADFDQVDEARVFNMPIGADALGMGNATTATWTGFSSDNPATLALWSDRRRTLNFTGSSAEYSDAPSVLAGEIGLTLPLFEKSIVDISLGTAHSERGISRGGDDFAIADDPYLVIMFGSQVASNLVIEGDALSLGVMGAPRVMGRTTYRFYDSGSEVLRTDSKVYGFGFGALYKPTEDVGVGASYNEWRINTVSMDYTLGMDESDRTALKSFKLGVGKAITDKLFVTAEAQRFSGIKEEWQMAGGAEYCFTDEVCGYTGWNGNGPTIGLGVYRDFGTINIGYAHRLADTDGQFGNSPTLSITITINF